MGFLNKIFGEKSPEEKENKRKNKFIKNETKINGIINEFKPEITKRPHKLLFRLNLTKNIKLAKTKEEYTICANQFKDWFNISLNYYKMDLSYSKQLAWVSQDMMSDWEWNNFLETLNEGFKALTISEQYDEVIEYNNIYFNEFFPLLAKIKIRDVKVTIRKIDVLNSIISIFTAFSLYKLGRFEESREIFNANANLNLEFENDEDDYEREVFGENNNEIVPRDFIKRMEQGTTLKSSNDTTIEKSNIDAEAAAKRIMDLRNEMENLKDNQELLRDIALNDKDIERRATAITYIDNENENELVRGMAVTNENISNETLEDILKNNNNQHLREMAKSSKDLRMG